MRTIKVVCLWYKLDWNTPRRRIHASTLSCVLSTTPLRFYIITWFTVTTAQNARQRTRNDTGAVTSCDDLVSDTIQTIVFSCGNSVDATCSTLLMSPDCTNYAKR